MKHPRLGRLAVVWVVLALVGRVLVACGDDGASASASALDATADGEAVEADHDAGNDVTDGGPAFRSCPGQFSGLCTEIEVPLDWAHPDGKHITIFVDKVSTSPNAKKVLWLLQGGPGGSGSDMVALAQQIANNRDDVDIFTLDHRGVGFSSRLGCPQEPGVFTNQGGPLDEAGSAERDAEARVGPCLDSVKAKLGGDLAFYTTSNAARDLKYVIDATKKQGQGVYVYGVSYGTYWAHRYMQIFPDHAAGVILDSIVPPEGEALSMFDLHGDLAGAKLGELCKKDPECSDRLGPDPWTHLKNIIATIDTGHCPEVGLTKVNRAFLFSYLQHWGLDVYPFAALWRYERCSAEDVAVLKTVASQTAQFAAPPGLFSQVLYYNVGFSELWETPPPSGEAMRTRFDSAVFPAGQAFELPQSAWPTYPKDEFVGKYAVTSTPVLMLNGTLDVQTPIETASRMKQHLNGPHQTFVTIPNANHGTIAASPTRMIGSSMPGPHCGLMIIESFLDDSLAVPDQSCLDNLYPLDFSGNTAANTFFFGTSGIWTGLHGVPQGGDPRDALARAVPHYPTPRQGPFGLF